jgi:hypothetical protein
LLDLGEEDEVLAKMKRFVLRKLAEDALEAVEDEARFEQRVVFAVSAVLEREGLAITGPAEWRP